MRLWVANRLDLRPAAERLGGLPEIQPVCRSINAVPALKGLISVKYFNLLQRSRDIGRLLQTVELGLGRQTISRWKRVYGQITSHWMAIFISSRPWWCREMKWASFQLLRLTALSVSYVKGSHFIRATDKVRSIDSACVISSPNYVTLFARIVRWDDANTWSNTGFCEEKDTIEIKLCTLSGALSIALFHCFYF